MSEQLTAPVIVDAQGQPARQAASKACPKCGAGPDRRRASGGFGGDIHPICGQCGYDFPQERE